MRCGTVPLSEVIRKNSLRPEDHLGYGKPGGLKTEHNTKEMGKRVKAAATEFGRGRPSDVFFEHGQWWVRWGPKTFSVVDAEGPGSIDGFGFEEV